MTPSARSEKRSTDTLILFAQPFVWDASKPKQPREVPQQGVGSPPELASARVTGRAEPPVSLEVLQLIQQLTTDGKLHR